LQLKEDIKALLDDSKGLPIMLIWTADDSYGIGTPAGSYRIADSRRWCRSGLQRFAPILVGQRKYRQIVSPAMAHKRKNTVQHSHGQTSLSCQVICALEIIDFPHFGFGGGGRA
jgi:catalase (peroxidase I)